MATIRFHNVLILSRTPKGELSYHVRSLYKNPESILQLKLEKIKLTSFENIKTQSYKIFNQAKKPIGILYTQQFRL